jgi:hypothetical protein
MLGRPPLYNGVSDTWRSNSNRGKRWAARQNLNDEHVSLVTNRALCQRTPGEFLVPLSIILVESYAGPKRVAQAVMGRRAKTITIGDGRF